MAGCPALQRVGDRGRLRDRARRYRHARARLARPPRARARPGAAEAGGHPARGDHPRPRRPLRPGAPDRRPRGLRGVGAPEPPALLRLRRRPRGRPSPPRRDRAPERRAEGPAAPRPLARRRAAPPRPRPAPRPRRRDRPRQLVGARDARPRAFPRRPLPARAAAADLRRPPARPRLAVLRLRLHAGPGGRVPGLAGHRRGARRTPRAVRPRAPLRRREGAHRRQPAAGGAAPRRRARGAPGRAVDRLRPAAGRLRRGLRPRDGGLAADQGALLPHASRGAGGGRAPAGRAGVLGYAPLHADRRADRHGQGPVLLLRVLPAQDGGRHAQPRGGAVGALDAGSHLRLRHLRRGRLAGREGQDGRHRLAHEARLRARGDGALHLRRGDGRGAAGDART